MKQIITDEFYGFKITKAECTDVNTIKVSGTFNANYSSKLGEFNIYNIIIDPTSLQTNHDGFNYTASIDCFIGNKICDFTIPEKPSVKMTVKEIEEKLGVKIEIVSEKE